ncbi:MAG: HDOD domain-containing protein [Gammaproteobacteria bacterium]
MSITSEAASERVDTGAGSAAVFAFVETLGRELADGSLSLPSFPEAVLQIQRVLNDPNAGTAAVARAVQTEPVFTAKLFRMANSVMMRRGGEALSDLGSVINRIGFGTVKHLAVALATRQILQSKKYRRIEAPLRELWDHCVTTAAIAFVLARETGSLAAEDALLAGLIHDIGVFYIYSRIETNPALFDDPESFEAIVQDWHTGVGRAILEEWNFPAALVEAVDEHESHDRDHVGLPDLTDVLIVANLLAHWGTPAERPVELAQVPALARLGLTPELALGTLERSRADVAAIKAALS